MLAQIKISGTDGPESVCVENPILEPLSGWETLQRLDRLVLGGNVRLQLAELPFRAPEDRGPRFSLPL